MRISFTKHLLSASILGLALAGCGGGSSEPDKVAAGDTTLAVAPTTTAAVANLPFEFPAGVPDLGTTAATTLKFTDTSATPGFSITADGNTATGVTTFGSCIFRVTASTFPAGHALANGQTVTVNPCNLNVATTGAVAGDTPVSRAVALVLAAVASTNTSVVVGVTSSGGLTLNGNNVGTVRLVFVTGGSGG